MEVQVLSPAHRNNSCVPARIAQLVERRAYTSVVLGSSPSARTTIHNVYLTLIGILNMTCIIKYMKYKTTISLLIIGVFAVSPFFINNFAIADTVSDLRAQLKSVLAKIEELKAELVLVESGVTIAESGGACVTIGRDLRKGMDNAEVKKLQIFLAQDASIYPERITSGYFGRLTELAVQRWQMRYGVISYGTAATTGYGAVGPKTRKAIASTCGSGGYVAGADNVISFSFTKSSGTAPLNTIVNIKMLQGACMSYQIDWGDGTPPVTKTASQSTACGNEVITYSAAHTYIAQGNYTATLYAGKGMPSTLPKVTSATISTTAGLPYVQIISPNSGETLYLGGSSTIKWEVANQPHDSAVVFYIVGPTGTYRFAKRSMSTKEFNWIVGDRVCDGNDCNVLLPPSDNYKIRALMYTPANACIDFCNAESVSPTFLTSDESDNTFTISQLGTSGDNPLSILQTSGKAPFMASINIELSSINTGAGNFEVDFGDGSMPYIVHVPAGEARSTRHTLSHTYVNTGSYTIRLRPIGAVQHIAESRIDVYEPEFNLKPASQAYAPVSVVATFDVDNSCSHLGETVRIYNVDWGDGSEDTKYETRTPQCSSSTGGAQSLSSKTLIHDYIRPGLYNPRLNISSGSLTYQRMESLTVEKPPFNISPSFGFAPLSVVAKITTDESCSVDGPTNVTYSIDWGDGTAKSEYAKIINSCDDVFLLSTTEREYSHNYAEIGRYTATLTVRKDNISSSYTRSQEVVVDVSVIRNGWRKLVYSIDNLNIGENMAAAVRAMFAK